MLSHENGSMQVRNFKHYAVTCVDKTLMRRGTDIYYRFFFFSFLHVEMKFKDKLPCNICNTKCVVLMKRNSLIFFK